MVCNFCEEHLEANKAAFKDPRLKLLYDDARAQLEASEGACTRYSRGCRLAAGSMLLHLSPATH